MLPRVLLLRKTKAPGSQMNAVVLKSSMVLRLGFRVVVAEEECVFEAEVVWMEREGLAR